MFPYIYIYIYTHTYSSYLPVWICDTYTIYTHKYIHAYIHTYVYSVLIRWLSLRPLALLASLAQPKHGGIPGLVHATDLKEFGA